MALPDTDAQLFTVADVCDSLRTDLAGLLRLLATGRFPLGIELGPGDVRWPRAVVIGWIKGLRAEAADRQELVNIDDGVS